MATIPSPLDRVLTRADDIDQPRPENPRYCDADETVAVCEACEACGCQWVTDPTAVLPDGTAECGFCGAWRGSLYRASTLSEFSDGERADGDPEDTIEYRWSGESPFMDWDELREYARILVLVDPGRRWAGAFVALASRCPYERHLYLRRLGE